jgi:flagellar biosynthesis/type III secretory pathway chaperone
MSSDQPKHRLDMLLVAFLSKELDIYRYLLDLSQKEREALTASKIETLNDVIAEKTHATQLLNKIEARRMELIAGIADSFNFNPNDFTLKHFVDWVDQTTAKSLLELRQDLSSIITKLQEENRINKHLITHCIALMDNSVNMLNSILYPESTYIHTGYFNKADGGGFIFSNRV